MNGNNALVSTKWLFRLLKNEFPHDLRLLDASWHLPRTKRVAREEFDKRHIPEAVFFDIDECCDISSPYSHMLPNKEQFENYVGNLGISKETGVIVYDNSPNFGFYSAPRVWWMFRVFGHENVSVLDGGFTKWCAEELPTTSSKIFPVNRKYVASYQSHLVKSYEDIIKNIQDKSYQTVDARSEGRFMGTEPEPRDGIESGHIIGSKNLCFQHIVDKENGCLLDTDSLKKLFTKSGTDLNKPLVATCGSGVTACCLAFAAFLCGKEDVPVYDGSWNEFYLRSSPNLRFCPSDTKPKK